MSETVSGNAGQEPPHNKPPGFEEAQKTGPIPSAYDVALDEINPIAPRLFSEHRWHEYFARLRKEDPVHFNETESAGRYCRRENLHGDFAEVRPGDDRRFGREGRLSGGPGVL